MVRSCFLVLLLKPAVIFDIDFQITMFPLYYCIPCNGPFHFPSDEEKVVPIPPWGILFSKRWDVFGAKYRRGDCIDIHQEKCWPSVIGRIKMGFVTSYEDIGRVEVGGLTGSKVWATAYNPG
jgi:hypothetical protein